MTYRARLSLFIVGMITWWTAFASEIALEGEFFEITPEAIESTEICLVYTFDVDLQDYIEIRAPDIIDEKKFVSFAVIVYEGQGQSTLIESVPELINGIRSVSIFPTRYVGDLTNIRVDFSYGNESEEYITYTVFLDPFREFVESMKNRSNDAVLFNCENRKGKSQ